jgi:hypothetical protein
MPKYTFMAYLTLPLRLWARGMDMMLRGWLHPQWHERSAEHRGLPSGMRPALVPIRHDRDLERH